MTDTIRMADNDKGKDQYLKKLATLLLPERDTKRQQQQQEKPSLATHEHMNILQNDENTIPTRRTFTPDAFCYDKDLVSKAKFTNKPCKLDLQSILPLAAMMLSISKPKN